MPASHASLVWLLAAALAGLWLAAVTGRRGLARSASGHAYRAAFAHVSLALASCLACTLLSALLASPDAPYTFGVELANAAAGLSFIAYAGLGRSSRTIWRNALIRLAVIGCAGLAALAAAALVPLAGPVPFAAGLAIWLVHERRLTALTLQSHQDLEHLRARVLELETERQLAQKFNQPVRDNLRKAG